MLPGRGCWLALACLSAACANSDPIAPPGGGGSGASSSVGGAGGAGSEGGQPEQGGAGDIGGTDAGGATTSGSPTCSDGIVDPTEECDDGNSATGDGCDDACVIECEAGATKNLINGNCYRVFTVALPWAQASAACVTWGGAPGLGNLVSIADVEEQEFVADLVSQASWIGGGDATTEGVYEWSDGTPWTYDIWAAGEPNDTTVEDCVFMRVDGTWDDHDCAMMWPACVCERRGAGTF